MRLQGGRLRVLVVDDEPAVRRVLRHGLSVAGYQVAEAQNAASTYAAIETDTIDMMILDLGLPDASGMDVIRRLREAGRALPIVVLSSHGAERIKIEALDGGADDYLTKPFGMGELLARLRAAQRHRLQQQAQTPVFRTGALEVDLVRRLVRVRGADVSLSPREYDLLRLLVLHAGKVLTHKLIQEQVWGTSTNVQYLRIYVRALRQKLELVPAMPQYILTETGVGYRLRPAN